MMVTDCQVDELVNSHTKLCHTRRKVYDRKREREKREKNSVCLLWLLLTLAIGVDVGTEKSEKSSSVAQSFHFEESL
jgi:hypothetical protein